MLIEPVHSKLLQVISLTMAPSSARVTKNIANWKYNFHIICRYLKYLQNYGMATWKTCPPNITNILSIINVRNNSCKAYNSRIKMRNSNVKIFHWKRRLNIPGAGRRGGCSCCVSILTSKDEYTNINTTRKVIAAPENGDNIYNPSVVELRYWASKSMTNQIARRNLVLHSSINSMDEGFIACKSCETLLKSC